MKKDYELNKNELSVKEIDQYKMTFINKQNEEKYLSFYHNDVEHYIVMDKNWLLFEGIDVDWYVFRDGQGDIYYVQKDEHSEQIFEIFDEKELKMWDRSKDSKWVGKKIWGYCQGYFHREHYRVYEHTIVSVGEDWVLAQNTDNDEKGEYYLAYFEQESELDIEKILTEMSSDEEKENWHPDNIGF